MPLTTARLCAVAGISRDALNKIMDPQRGGLRTPIPAPESGAARLFSRSAGLEVAFVVALGQAGMLSLAARALAAEWVEKASVGRLERYWTWNPRAGATSGGGPAHLEYTDPIPYPDLAFMLADGEPGASLGCAAALVTRDRHEIVRRIDSCLADADAAVASMR